MDLAEHSRKVVTMVWALTSAAIMLCAASPASAADHPLAAEIEFLCQ